jgi:hypothetical protein
VSAVGVKSEAGARVVVLFSSSLSSSAFEVMSTYYQCSDHTCILPQMLNCDTIISCCISIQYHAEQDAVWKLHVRETSTSLFA